jgi:single-strand DNA-binding protein
MSYLPSQTAVTDFGLAVNRKFNGKDGQKREEVCFVDCKAFGKSGETLNKYTHKGDSILIEGRLSFDTWEKDGQKRSKHYIIVDNFQFLSGKPQNGSGTANEEKADNPQQEDDIPF